MIEWVSVVMIVVNSEGWIVLVNNKVCVLCGYEKFELLNVCLDKLLMEDVCVGYLVLM